MSTRGQVAILDSDGKVRSIYNHFDSYFDGLGKTLVGNFSTEEKVKKLIERGDGSYVLDEEPYSDGNTEAVVFENEDTWLKFVLDDVFMEYGYIWKDGAWYGFDGYERNFKGVGKLNDDGWPEGYEKPKE